MTAHKSGVKRQVKHQSKNQARQARTKAKNQKPQPKPIPKHRCPICETPQKENNKCPNCGHTFQ